MEGQGCVARGHGNGPGMVRRVMPSQVVPEGVGEWPEEAWVAGGWGAARVAGCARWWGLRSPQWGRWVRRCAAPRQPLAHTEGARGGRRLAVPVDGWWRGGMGACGVRMLAGVCAVPVVLVRAVSVSCAVDAARARGGGVLRRLGGRWVGSHGW